LTDTSYIPCVNFWPTDDAFQLGVYAHGIDFGTKGCANLVELAALHHHVADACTVHTRFGDTATACRLSCQRLRAHYDWPTRGGPCARSPANEK
jgi:hypothetical protein